MSGCVGWYKESVDKVFDAMKIDQETFSSSNRVSVNDLQLGTPHVVYCSRYASGADDFWKAGSDKGICVFTGRKLVWLLQEGGKVIAELLLSVYQLLNIKLAQSRPFKGESSKR